jgi:hypothetical protein
MGRIKSQLRINDNKLLIDNLQCFEGHLKIKDYCVVNVTAKKRTNWIKI